MPNLRYARWDLRVTYQRPLRESSDWLLRLRPAAGFAIQPPYPSYPQVTASYTPQNGYYPLAPWAGFAVLYAWVALTLGLATYLLRRRDA
jgi:hypothetical protein